MNVVGRTRDEREEERKENTKIQKAKGFQFGKNDKGRQNEAQMQTKQWQV